MLGRIFLHPMPFPIVVILSPLAISFCQDIAVLVILFYSSSQLLGALRHVITLYIFKIQSWVYLLETLNNGNKWEIEHFCPCRFVVYQLASCQSFGKVPRAGISAVWSLKVQKSETCQPQRVNSALLFSSL